MIHTEKLIPELPQPQFALIAYGTHRTQSLTLLNHEVAVDPESGATRIGAGRILSHTDAAGLARMLQGGEPSSRTPMQPLNRTLVGLTESACAWVMPAARRKMWFAAPGKTLGLTVPWPRLLVMAFAGRLVVAALPPTGPVRAGTRLCHAPLCNVGPDGDVCLGNAEAPRAATPDFLPNWEGLLTDTKFSHVNHDWTLRIGKAKRPVDTQRHIAFWRKLDRAHRFPMANLMPMNRTVGDLLRQSAP